MQFCRSVEEASGVAILHVVTQAARFLLSSFCSITWMMSLCTWLRSGHYFTHVPCHGNGRKRNDRKVAPCSQLHTLLFSSSCVALSYRKDRKSTPYRGSHLSSEKGMESSLTDLREGRMHAGEICHIGLSV